MAKKRIHLGFVKRNTAFTFQMPVSSLKKEIEKARKMKKSKTMNVFRI